VTAISQSLQQRFEHLEKVLSSQSFLKMEGLNNEIPFFVFAHPADEQFAVDHECSHLLARLRSQGISVSHIDLYDTAVDLIKSDGDFEDILELESSSGKEEVKETLQNLTDPETELVPAIAAQINKTPFDMLVLTGAGLVFPYMRSHAVLNNLQSVIKDRPVLLFFPGEYTFTDGRGQSLDLFGKLNEDKYYRAYNIENFKR